MLNYEERVIYFTSRRRFRRVLVADLGTWVQTRSRTPTREEKDETRVMYKPHIDDIRERVHSVMSGVEDATVRELMQAIPEALSDGQIAEILRRDERYVIVGKRQNQMRKKSKPGNVWKLRG